ncbi:MAG: methyl-accepting chemotaxis protein [Nitrospirae bacterium]|nr:methyl-accepting chemotaxis protein [Nitrospirota bacterium]
MRFRKRFYIHSIQKKYAVLTFLLLISYTFVLAVALFLPPMIKLAGGSSLEEQAAAAAQFLALSDRLWPAILISVPIFMVVSLWVTHRFAGPVYRLEQSLKQIASGDLGFQVRFRSGDDLQELAVLLNQIIHQQAAVLKTVQSVRQRLLEIMGQIRSKTVAPEQLNPTLEQIQIQIEQIESLLRQFNLDRPETPPAPSEGVPKKFS